MRALRIAIVPLLCCLAVPALARAKDLTLPADRRVRVAVVLTEGATMIDFAGPWEVFQDVHMPERGEALMHPFELYTVGSAKAPTQVSGGMTVVPDYAFADAPVPDIVIVGAQRGDPALGGWLREQHGKGRLVMSVCTGAFLLARAGLLDGRPATTHHDFFDTFAGRFPKVNLERGPRFVQSDATTFTAGGLTSGVDLALHIVELYCGREVAERTAVYMEYHGQDWKS